MQKFNPPQVVAKFNEIKVATFLLIACPFLTRQTRAERWPNFVCHLLDSFFISMATGSMYSVLLSNPFLFLIMLIKTNS